MTGRPNPPVADAGGDRPAGGIDVGTGVRAYLLVKQATGSTVVAGLAFSIGFVALLARSELFTEILPVPVTAVAAQHGLHRGADPAVGSVARGETWPVAGGSPG